MGTRRGQGRLTGLGQGICRRRAGRGRGYRRTARGANHEGFWSTKGTKGAKDAKGARKGLEHEGHERREEGVKAGGGLRVRETGRSWWRRPTGADGRAA